MVLKRGFLGRMQKTASLNFCTPEDGLRGLRGFFWEECKKPLRLIFALRRMDYGDFFGRMQKTASLNFCTPEDGLQGFFLGRMQKTASLNFCTPEDGVEILRGFR